MTLDAVEGAKEVLGTPFPKAEGKLEKAVPDELA